MNGLLLIDKPAGISSFGVIRQLRQITGIQKIGHAGTLDPLATGLLIILVGAATKQADRFLKQDKTYYAEITLGATSLTDDAEGPIQPVSDRAPSQSEIEKVLKQFVGEHEQLPPQRSAIKVGGQRAYRLSRKGQQVALKPRPAKVHSIELLAYDYPRLKVKTEVGSGAYIRSLARDSGAQLGTGAYLSNLRRTAVGKFRIEEALSLPSLSLSQVKKALQSPESV